MSDDQDSSSSTGLIIGMIVGGVVVLLLIVGGIGAFFFMAHTTREDVHFHAVEREAMIQELVEEKIVVAPEPRPADPAPPTKAPEPEDVRKARERLMGIWVSDGVDKRRPSLEFRPNGEARWLWKGASINGMEAGDDGWEVKEVAKDRLKILFFANRNKELRYERQLRFDGDDRLVIEGPLKEDPRLVLNKDGNAVYLRQRHGEKPMSEDEDGGGSGMIIGIVIGGVVVLALLVGAAFIFLLG